MGRVGRMRARRGSVRPFAINHASGDSIWSGDWGSGTWRMVEVGVGMGQVEGMEGKWWRVMGVGR